MYRKKYAPIGSVPGTLVLDANSDRPNIQSFIYDQNHVEENICSGTLDSTEYFKELDKIISSTAKSKEVTWLDIKSVLNEETLKRIALAYSLHDLTISDIVNVPQRPKIEEQESYVLIILAIPTLEEDCTISVEQISIVVGTNYVLTFQEHDRDVFNPIRQRIRQAKGSIRKSGSDHLAYALIDAIIDNYFPILEEIGTHLEEIEEELVDNPNKSTLSDIYTAKRTLLQLRRSIWPHREIFSAILRDEFKIFKKTTRTFVRDIYDHTVEIIDVVETYRELAGGFMDIYLSSISNKLNDVMKVLTVISTIFIPLSFFAGIYGMNFENMPELHSKYGYPILLVAMFVVGATMLFIFWKKGWLSSEKISEDS